ncbi:hypothetical protein D7Y21_04420 [Corallococcus sp. AB045]|uniref:LON peptidase substrate-binding domain-containing protein n=1 Tax=Corallococcus sp. AB045 TaxID=2316719 RepID=UPI000EBA4193|nr:LON peptidase substrate-binding domain-containing protein [Corallococcus sp. AB045]RKH90975.1 hypothetical protein D7Y21_04420 [Corallococcus sp. AB045]
MTTDQAPSQPGDSLRGALARWSGHLLLFLTLVGLGLSAAIWRRFDSALVLAVLAGIMGQGLAHQWPGLLAARADLLLRRAYQAADQKNLKRALRLAHAAWTRAPQGTQTQADSLAMMAYVRVRQAHGAEALRVLSHVPEDFVPPSSSRAEAYLLTGETALALKWAEDAHAQRPDPHALHLRVKALLHLRRLDEARELLVDATQEQVCMDAFHEFQRAALEAGRLEDAVVLGQRGYEQQAYPLGAWLLARTFEAMGQPADAALWQERATKAGFTDKHALPLTEKEPLNPLELDVTPGARQSRTWIVTHWALATLAGYVLGGLFVEVPYSYLFVTAPEPLGSGSALVHGLLFGAVLGLAQWLVLRHQVPDTRLWIPVTALGLGIGRWAMHQLTAFLPPTHLSGSHTITLVQYVMLTGALMAGFQVCLLGRWFSKAGVWPLAPLLGGTLGLRIASGLWRRVSYAYEPSFMMYVPEVLINNAMQGLLIGIAEGWLLSWLLQERSRRFPLPVAKLFLLEPPHQPVAFRPPVLDAHTLPESLPLFPMRDGVLLPGQVLTVAPAPMKSVEAFNAALTGNRLIVVVTQRDERVEEPAFEDLPTVGVLAFAYPFQAPDGSTQTAIHGLARVRLEAPVPHATHLRVRARPFEEPLPRNAQAMLDVLRRHYHAFLRAEPGPLQRRWMFLTLEDPRLLADFIASNLAAPVTEHQAILEEADPDARTRLVLALVERASRGQAQPSA